MKKNVPTGPVLADPSASVRWHETAAGAGAIALFLVAIWAGFKVFTADTYPGHLLCYLTLALISLGTTAFCEVLLNLLGSQKTSLRSPYFALMLLAGLLLAATYGPRIFIKFYEADDWIYLPYSFGKLDWAYLNTPINDHYVPVIRLILYYLGKFSGPSYYSNAFAFYLANMLAVSALGRVVRSHTASFGILAAAVLSFAMWPTFEGARIWFGGGFWLALPLAPFLAMIVLVRRILLEDASVKNYIVLLFLAMATVLSSSQILIPFIFIFVYALPYLEAADATQRPSLFRRGLAISAIVLLPTAIGFAGRTRLLKNAPDFSGLIDGSYFTNLMLFVKAKVGFEKFSTTILVCIILFCSACALYRAFKRSAPHRLPALPTFLFVMLLFGLTSPKGTFTPVTTPLWIAGLAIFGAFALFRRLAAGRPQRSLATTSAYAMTLCGMAMLAFYIFQVGVGRRWGTSTALAYYYVMFPLAGCWLAGAGIMAIRAASAAPVLAEDASAQAIGGAVWVPRTPLSTLVTAALVVVFVYSVHLYFPTQPYVRGVMAQKDFMRDIGLAACSEAGKVAPGERLFVRARQPFDRCPDCEALLQGHEDFVSSMSEGSTTTGGGFQMLANISAGHQCPEVAGRLTSNLTQANKSTDGNTEESRRFYEKYFK